MFCTTSNIKQQEIYYVEIRFGREFIQFIVILQALKNIFHEATSLFFVAKPIDKN